MATFYVPEKYVGKSLKQLQNETGFAFRPDVLAGLAGGSESAPLTSGQSFNYRDDPGASEYQFLQKYFTPQNTYQAQQDADFAAGQKAEEDAFMAALNERVAGQESLTDAAGRIGGELGLPSLRESALNLTQTLSNIGGQIRDVAPTQQTISKQVGISAPHLQQRIAAETAKLQPAYETAGRAAESALTAQQFGEQQLTTQLGYLLQDQAKELEPFYQAALPLLSDRLAREQSNYTQNKQNELNILLTQMSQNFQASQAELDRASQLSLAEMQYNQVKNSQSIETIGGRKVLVTYDNNGNIVARVDLGASGTGGTGSDGW